MGRVMGHSQPVVKSECCAASGRKLVEALETVAGVQTIETDERGEA